MHMIGESRARAASEVCADVQSRRLKRLANTHDAGGNQLGQDRAFVASEKFRRSDMATRRNHQMAVVVRIAVEHDDRIGALIYHEPTLALGSIELPEAEDARVLLAAGGPQIFVTPRRPQPKTIGAPVAIDRGFTARSAPCDVARHRSEERRVGKECRSR